VARAMALAAAATVVWLLSAAGPVTANGVIPMAAGSPVIDADVMVTVSVDGSPTEVGPLAVANSLTHFATYELSLEPPELAREKGLFKVEVDSLQGPAVFEAEMNVPDVVGKFNGDSVATPSSTAPAEQIPVAAEATPTPTAQTADPETGTPQDEVEDTSIGRLVYSGFAVVAGLAGVGAGVWGLVRYWRRRSADSE